MIHKRLLNRSWRETNHPTSRQDLVKWDTSSESRFGARSHGAFAPQLEVWVAHESLTGSGVAPGLENNNAFKRSINIHANFPKLTAICGGSVVGVGLRSFGQRMDGILAGILRFGYVSTNNHEVGLVIRLLSGNSDGNDGASVRSQRRQGVRGGWDRSNLRRKERKS
jgi:hypothetical protein